MTFIVLCYHCILSFLYCVTLYYVIGIVPHVVIADHLWQLTLVFNQDFHVHPVWDIVYTSVASARRHVFIICHYSAEDVQNRIIFSRWLDEPCAIRSIADRYYAADRVHS